MWVPDCACILQNGSYKGLVGLGLHVLWSACNILLMNKRELLDFVMVDSICVFHKRLFAMWTPSYFSLLTDLRVD